MAASTSRDPAAPDLAPTPPRPASTPADRPVPTLSRATAGTPGHAPAPSAPRLAPSLGAPVWTAAVPGAAPVITAPAYGAPVLTPAPVTGSIALTPPPSAAGSTVCPAPPERTHVPLSGPIPDAPDALTLLRGYAGGAPAPSPGAAAVLDRALGQVSELERHALAGEATPVDPTVLGAVSGARVQVEHALALLESERVELELVEALLGEVDGIRLRLKALAPSVDAAIAAELKRISGGLVERAMELSTRATQQVTAAVEQASAAPASPVAQPAPGTRVLSNEAAGPEPLAVRTKVMVGVLAAAVLFAGGYHAWRFTQRHTVEMPTLPGAPAHTFVVNRGASQLLVLDGGAHVDPAELRAFIEGQAARGYSVRQLSPTSWDIRPADPKQRKKPIASGGLTP